MSFYECVFIARQDLSAAQADALLQEYKKLIKDHKGKVSKTEYWGLKKMAYPIKKNSRGHYTLLNIEAGPEAIQELERKMRLNEDVLRYLTIKVKSLDEEPSLMMKYAKNAYENDGASHPSHRSRDEEASPSSEHAH